jgi:DNA-binding response OmpR family regulator
MPRLAVVDDDPVVAMLLRLAMEAEGHVVRTFERAETLLQALRDETFELIVLDLHLDGMSGLEALRAVRERGLAPDARIVMLTGSEDDADIVRAHRAGANGYLAKPFEPRRLMEQLGFALSCPAMVWLDDLHQVTGEALGPARAA